MFDGLDYTYPPHKFSGPFQIGPQPFDMQSYLTGTQNAYHFFIVPSQELPLIDMIGCFISKKMYGLPSPKFSKINYTLKNIHTMLNLKHKKDNANVRFYALKVETLVKQGWYNEYPSTKKTSNVMKFFTRGLPK